MSKLALFPGTRANLETVCARMVEEFPHATASIVVVFDGEGTMHIDYSCSNAELAYSGSRLLHLANHGDR